MNPPIPCACPDCGPVQVTTGVLLIRTGAVLCETWRCPGCDAWVTRTCDDMRRAVLVVRGSKTLVTEAHEDVPALTEDDFLAFGRALEAAGDVAGMARDRKYGLRREQA